MCGGEDSDFKGHKTVTEISGRVVSFEFNTDSCLIPQINNIYSINYSTNRYLTKRCVNFYQYVIGASSEGADLPLDVKIFDKATGNW